MTFRAKITIDSDLYSRQDTETSSKDLLLSFRKYQAHNFSNTPFTICKLMSDYHQSIKGDKVAKLTASASCELVTFALKDGHL